MVFRFNYFKLFKDPKIAFVVSWLIFAMGHLKTYDLASLYNKSEDKVADFLNETWQLIIGANGYLDIFKDVNSEFKIDKYSSTEDNT